VDIVTTVTILGRSGSC